MANYYDATSNCSNTWKDKFKTNDWDSKCSGYTPTYLAIEQAKDTLDVSIV